MSFVKLDCGIVDSSLWIERDVRSVFLTALVMAVPVEITEPTPQIEVRRIANTGWMVPPGWYGLVQAAGVGIVRRDGCDPEKGMEALEALSAPDPDSRSQDFEGRRLVRVDGGYLVLNYFKYRDRDYTAAERMRRLRARRKTASVTESNVTRNDVDVRPNVTQAEGREQKAEAEAEKPKRLSGKSAKQNTTGEAALLLVQIRDMAQTVPIPGQGAKTVITKERVASLGPDILKAYEAVGGSSRILQAEGKDHSFLARDFANALEAARA